MLSINTLVESDGVAIADVACRHERGVGAFTEHRDRYAIVFVRRGCFVRSVDGVEQHLDPTLAYAMSPGQVERYDHPHSCGDDCTPVTQAARRRLADDARELLVENPNLSVPALASQVSCSPHHLSRVFARRTGTTVTQYRNRLRTLLALERLEDGEADLARLAADLGFADHSHLVRVVKEQTGNTPSRSRRALNCDTAASEGEHPPS